MSDPVLLLGGLAIVLAVAGLIAMALRSARRHLAARAVVWRQLADELGGRYEPASGPWYRREGSRLLVTVDGVELIVDAAEAEEDEMAVGIALGTIGLPGTGVAESTLRATARVSASGELLVERKTKLSAIGKGVARLERRLGRRDLDLGDAAFDEAFLVDGNDESWVRAHLGEELRNLHLEHPDIRVRLRDGSITARASADGGAPDTLRAVLRLAAAHARALA